MEYDTLYGVLLNTEGVSQLRPFNFPRNLDKIKNENTGILREWLEGFTVEGSSVENTGKRISRAIARLSKEYDFLLPEAMRGEASFAIMFRVFFLSSDDFMSLPFKITATLQLTKTLLWSILFLDVLFTRDTFRFHDCSFWLEKLLCSSTGIMATMRELGS